MNKFEKAGKRGTHGAEKNWRNGCMHGSCAPVQFMALLWQIQCDFRQNSLCWICMLQLGLLNSGSQSGMGGYSWAALFYAWCRFLCSCTSSARAGGTISERRGVETDREPSFSLSLGQDLRSVTRGPLLHTHTANTLAAPQQKKPCPTLWIITGPSVPSAPLLPFSVISLEETIFHWVCAVGVMLLYRQNNDNIMGRIAGELYSHTERAISSIW